MYFELFVDDWLQLIRLVDDYISGTDGPRLGAWTSISQFTEAEDAGIQQSKSTRHILASELRSVYFTPKMTNKNLLNRNGELEYNEVNSGKLQGFLK